MKNNDINKEKLIDFFNSDELELPRRRGDTNFEDYLKKLFENHKKLIKDLPEIPEEEKCIGECENIARGIKEGKDVSKKISDGILECLKEYFNGRVSDAYIKLKEMLDDNGVKRYLERIISIDVDKNSNYAPFSDLYRVTVTDEDLSEKPLRLFHVPYNLREKIGTNRYSIPGFPCLYIGGSAELCWEELNSPDDNKLWLTKYNLIPKTIRFLNFGYRPAIWAACINAGDHVDRTGLIIGHAVCWPLIAACSIIRKDPKSKFAPEYVIPQMLLQWIVDYQDGNGKIDGIRYFSTKILDYSPEAKPNVNYVFPAIKSDGDKMYSTKLAGKFKITKPILINKINDSYLFSQAEYNLKNSTTKPLLDIINKKNKNNLKHIIHKMSIRMKKLEKMVRSLKNQNN